MIFIFLQAAGVIVELILALMVLFTGKRNLNRMFFFLLTLSLIAWSIVNYMSIHTTDQVMMLFWMRTVMFFAVFQATFFLLFTVTFPNKNISKNRIPLLVIYLLLVAGSLYITLSPYMFSGVTFDIETGARSPEIAKGMLLFVIVAIGSILAGLINLIKKYLRNKGIIRKQIQFLLLGIFLMFLFIIIFNFILVTVFKIDLFVNLGQLYTLPFVILTAYSIAAYRLFDIKVIIRRTVVYSVLLAFVLGIYSAVIFASAGILGGTADINRSTMIPNLIAAILIAIGFEPLRKFLTRVTDKYLFKQAYDPQLVLKQLSDTLVSVLALDEALLSMMKIVKDSLRISHTAVLVIYDESTEENRVRVHSVGYLGVQKNGLNLKVSDPIIKYIRQKRSLEVVEELERRLEDENITSSRVKRMIKGANVDPLDIIRQIKIISSVVKKAKSLDIAVLIPIIVRGKVIGIFVIGPKLSGDSFTDADLKMLEIISGQTASAIEQARLYEDDQTKSEFVSIASHELLTPTTAIEGYLSMILDEHMASVDKTAQKYLERVQTSAHRLSNLVKDLLSVSRIEAGRIKIKIEPVQVEPIIENVVGDLLPTTQAKRLSLTFLKPDNPLPLGLVDPDKLTQVVINLVGNAIKYTPEGSVLVLAESVEDKIKITIEDTGIGIRNEDLPHLFEKFYRVDNTETVGIVGSGLGLYISKSMIELMDGAIDVESTEWHGSRFIITLPAVVDSEEEAKE